MKNSNNTIGNRTRDLPTCSAMPQPTALPRAPVSSLQTSCIAVTCVCCCVFTEVFVRVSEPSLCFCVQIQMQTLSLQGLMQSVWANQYQYVGRHSIAFKFRLT
jgi:hypothetical protein